MHVLLPVTLHTVISKNKCPIDAYVGCGPLPSFPLPTSTTPLFAALASHEHVPPLLLLLAAQPPTQPQHASVKVGMEEGAVQELV